MRKVSLFIFLAVLWFAKQSSVFALEGNYAYVDIAKVFDEYQKTKDNDRTLQDAGKKKESERDALVHDIRQMKDELALLNDDAKAKKQESMEGKIRELQAFDQKAKEELGKKRAEVVKEIFKDIDDTVKRYGERNGLDLVFNEKVLLYHSAKQDITTSVLDELNKGYSKGKK